jgi:hypothetical protein
MALKTYLLYVSPTGKYYLAAKDLGHDGNYPHGWRAGSDSVDIHVEWRGDPFAEVPLKISTTKDYSLSIADANSVWPRYSTFRDGTLVGSFPMREKLSSMRYTKADGSADLSAIAGILAFYFSDDGNADWVEEGRKTKAKDEATRLWFDELARLNPSLSREGVIAVGTHIKVPNEPVFSEYVYRKIRRYAAGK